MRWLGAAGMQNATEDSDKAEAISDKTAVQKDKKRVSSLYLQAIVGAAILTTVFIII